MINGKCFYRSMNVVNIIYVNDKECYFSNDVCKKFYVKLN